VNFWPAGGDLFGIFSFIFAAACRLLLVIACLPLKVIVLNRRTLVESQADLRNIFLKVHFLLFLLRAKKSTLQKTACFMICRKKISFDNQSLEIAQEKHY